MKLSTKLILIICLVLLPLVLIIAQSFYDGANPVLTVNSTIPVSTLASNRSAPNSLSVGASPHNMTNPMPFTVVIYVGAGVVTGYQINGTTLASGLTLTGVTTLILQPNEWATITYTVAPTIKWKPL